MRSPLRILFFFSVFAGYTIGIPLEAPSNLPPEITATGSLYVALNIPLVTEEEWAAAPFSSAHYIGENDNLERRNIFGQNQISHRSSAGLISRDKAFSTCYVEVSEDWQNKLQSGELFGYCSNKAGTWLRTFIDLDSCIMNNFGKLSWLKNGGFSRSCHSITIPNYGVDSTPSLVASCYIGGSGSTLRTSIELNEGLTNVDGRFVC